MLNWAKSRIQNWLNIVPGHRIEAMSECISAIDKFLEEKDFITQEDFEKTLEDYVLQGELDAEGFLKEEDIENTVSDCVAEDYRIGEIEDAIKNIESSIEGVEIDISEKEDDIDDLELCIEKLEKLVKTLSDKLPVIKEPEREVHNEW